MGRGVRGEEGGGAQTICRSELSYQRHFLSLDAASQPHYLPAVGVAACMRKRRHVGGRQGMHPALEE